MEIDTLTLAGLPDEMLYGICQKLPYKELGRLVQGSRDIKRVCNEILDKRLEKEVQTTLINVKQEMDRLNGPAWLGLKFDNAIFYKDKFQEDPIGETTHKVIIARSVPQSYEVIQDDVGGQEGLFISPWILKGIKDPQIEFEYYSDVSESDAYRRFAHLSNEEELKAAVRNLVRYGYELYIRK